MRESKCYDSAFFYFMVRLMRGRLEPPMLCRTSNDPERNAKLIFKARHERLMQQFNSITEQYYLNKYMISKNLNELLFRFSMRIIVNNSIILPDLVNKISQFIY
tara:strand:+ start:1086 stop:1397 length:312 start_codon:yes stop_codon:yes gene_type:complete